MSGRLGEGQDMRGQMPGDPTAKTQRPPSLAEQSAALEEATSRTAQLALELIRAVAGNEPPLDGRDNVTADRPAGLSGSLEGSIRRVQSTNTVLERIREQI